MNNQNQDTERNVSCNQIGESDQTEELFAKDEDVISISKRLTEKNRQAYNELAMAADPFYSAVNMKHLRRGIAALNEGRGTEHELIEDGTDKDDN